jgi:hypothetical protein
MKSSTIYLYPIYEKIKILDSIACKDRLTIPIMCDIIHIINKDHNIWEGFYHPTLN